MAVVTRRGHRRGLETRPAIVQFANVESLETHLLTASLLGKLAKKFGNSCDSNNNG